MLPLSSIGEQIANKRKALGLTQPELAKRAMVGLSTLDALENGHLGELGYSKITNILAALGLELKLQEAGARRPTMEELLEEESRDQGLDNGRLFYAANSSPGLQTFTASGSYVSIAVRGDGLRHLEQRTVTLHRRDV